MLEMPTRLSERLASGRTRLRKQVAAGATAGTVLCAVTMLGAAATLSITFDAPAVTCALDGSGGVVSAGYTITASSASAAVVTETLKDSGGNTVASASKSYTLPAGNVADGGGWTFAGRTKAHDGTFTASALADGEYSLEVCATQPGSQGNPAKSACITEALVVDCSGTIETACSAQPFGEVVGNRHIRVDAAAQVNFKGDFGTLATLTITGPGFAESATIPENGNSCNYHANWKFTNGAGADIYGNSGPGTYTATVTGNGKTLTFDVTLGD
jgi:hypothetical protein